VGAHGTTFGGNPVACAAGLATLAVIERDGLVARAAETGERFLGALRARRPSWPSVRDIRGRALMIGVELDGDAKPTRDACLARGLLVTTAGKNVLRILPPLNVTQSEVDEALELLDGVLRS
jgi:acetylornithine/succinyldiaminopimelate/putrescine aminotransferase